MASFAGRPAIALLIAFSFPTYACASLEKERLQAERYRNQAVTVLKWLFPKDHELIDNTEIVVIDTHPLGTGVCGPGCIRISLATIRIMPNAFTYYAVLAHEFGHIRGKHKSTLVATGWFTAETDFELMERQELEADQVAIQAFRRRSISACYVKQVVDMFMSKYPPDDGPNPYRTIIEKRIAAADAACKAEKTP